MAEKLLKTYPWSGMKITETDDYIRLRIKDPEIFKKNTIRTDDIGKPGFTKRIAGQLTKNNKWTTQAYIFNKKDFGRRDALYAALKYAKALGGI